MNASPDPEATPYIIAFIVIVTGIYVVVRLARERRGSRRIAISGQPGFVGPRRRGTHDLAVLFTPGAGGGDGPPRSIEPVASLYLPSGKIVACDPLVLLDPVPFAREVAPGTYPVDASVVQFESDRRVAALRIVFGPGAPVRWEAATIVGQDASLLASSERFGYGVDAGVGCFMDATTCALLLERAAAIGDGGGNYDDDVLAAELNRDHVDHHPIAGRAENCAIAHSGWGDGIYSSYWGLDVDGRPLWLVTDFQVV